MRGMIWAQTSTGVIGKDDRIPWRYPADMRRFKALTTGSAIVMGRRTWESIGKPLPVRKNIVVAPSYFTADKMHEMSRMTMPEHTSWAIARDVVGAVTLSVGSTDVWFIGGARIYQAAMDYVDMIDVTYVPDHVDDGPGVVRAPAIDPDRFFLASTMPHPEDATLRVEVWRKRT